MQTYNDALEWAARWAEDSLKGETNERVVEFGKNMAMTFRAAAQPEVQVSPSGEASGSETHETLNTRS